jgi:hypothetical protein
MKPNIVFLCKAIAFRPPHATRWPWLHRCLAFLAGTLCRPTAPEVVLRSMAEVAGNESEPATKSLRVGDVMAVGLILALPPNVQLAAPTSLSQDAAEFLNAMAADPSRN